VASARRSSRRRSWRRTRAGNGPETSSVGFVKTLGILELLAAVGLILPAVLDIVPIMVPVTAVCWVVLMIGAMITHGRYSQFKLVLLNAVYLALAAFVAWGRFGVESFTA